MLGFCLDGPRKKSNLCHSERAEEALFSCI
jgi:hypothetical protein